MIVISLETLAKFPFERTVKTRIELVWFESVLIKDPSFRFQILIVLSVEPLTKFPFGRTVNAYTVLVWFESVLIKDPSFGFHILIVLSPEPQAKFPFGRTVNAYTVLVWFESVWIIVKLYPLLSEVPLFIVLLVSLFRNSSFLKIIFRLLV